MKIKIFQLFVALYLILFLGCDPSKKITSNDDQKIEIILLQTNDVYEIAPLEGGNAGGMARVGQIKKDLLKKNPNVVSIMAGDFLNPSVTGTLKFQDERIKGKQMVEVMNVAGIDIVTFGNHEFDLKEDELQKRINESQFDWIGGNVLQVKGSTKTAFQKNGTPIPTYLIKEYKDADGTTLKIGYIGNCLNANQPDYVAYDDAAASIKNAYNEIKDKADVVIAVTHQAIEDDINLAEELKDVPLFIGGHEHNNMIHQIGKVRITKADANAKSVYIHRLNYDKATKTWTLDSKLKMVDQKIPFDPATNAVVQKWITITNGALKRDGINPDAIVTKLDHKVDAREVIIRNEPSEISTAVVKSISMAATRAQGSVLNTGSIRIDDILEGQITEYDIVRLLPFGGAIAEVNMKGATLIEMVTVGRTKNVGKGGFLALDKLEYVDDVVYIGDEEVDSDKMYRIALPSFLLTGLESNLDFLKPDGKNIQLIEGNLENPEWMGDIRLAVIAYLKANGI